MTGTPPPPDPHTLTGWGFGGSMNWEEKEILKMRLFAVRCDLSNKLDEYKGRHPKEDLKPLETKLDVLSEVEILIEELWREARGLNEENERLINHIMKTQSQL